MRPGFGLPQRERERGPGSPVDRGGGEHADPFRLDQLVDILGVDRERLDKGLFPRSPRPLGPAEVSPRRRSHGRLLHDARGEVEERIGLTRPRGRPFLAETSPNAGSSPPMSAIRFSTSASLMTPARSRALKAR
jgi:hypothetical protein